MKASQITLGITCALLIAACSDSRESAAQTSAPSPAAAIAPEPGSASGETPSVTASSAAASAPECKDIEKADPKTCHPEDAVGDPNAK